MPRLASAIQSLESIIPGLRVVRVEPEELVTASEIAARTDRTRENIRQLFQGSRGNGDFPRPATWLSDRTRLWNWGEVARWLANRPAHDIEEWRAEVISGINALLILRRFFELVSASQESQQTETTGTREPHSPSPVYGFPSMAAQPEFTQIFSWLSSLERDFPNSAPLH